MCKFHVRILDSLRSYQKTKQRDPGWSRHRVDVRNVCTPCRKAREDCGIGEVNKNKVIVPPECYNCHVVIPDAHMVRV